MTKTSILRSRDLLFCTPKEACLLTGCDFLIRHQDNTIAKPERPCYACGMFRSRLCNAKSRSLWSPSMRLGQSNLAQAPISLLEQYSKQKQHQEEKKSSLRQHGCRRLRILIVIWLTDSISGTPKNMLSSARNGNLWHDGLWNSVKVSPQETKLR